MARTTQQVRKQLEREQKKHVLQRQTVDETRNELERIMAANGDGKYNTIAAQLRTKLQRQDNNSTVTEEYIEYLKAELKALETSEAQGGTPGQLDGPPAPPTARPTRARLYPTAGQKLGVSPHS